MTASSAVVFRPDAGEVVAGLRVWAAGCPADEAAVELLAALAKGVPQLLDPCPVVALPWLVPCPRPGVWALEGRPLAQAVNLFPKQVRPLVLAVARLLTDGDRVGMTLAGDQVAWLGPVFTVLAEAAGCTAVLAAVHGPAQPLLTGWDEAA